MALLGVVAAFALLVFGLVSSGAYGNWREASRRGGQQYADPFRIAGVRPIPQVRRTGTAKNPADPFIDSEGYRASIDHGEAQFGSGIVH